jgi:hypothetical protein
MNKACILFIAVLAALSLSAQQAGSDLAPVLGVSAFGGAARGLEDHAGAIGGVEGFGLLPLGQRFGLQGGMRHQGGNGGYRLGLSLGPVYGYDAGKLGLFADYEHTHQGSNNFIYVRGVWAHYFDQFDLVLSYSHPVNSVQHDRVTIVPPGCTPTQHNKSVPAINELKGVLRFYPTQNLELDGGVLVNSFAGPDHDEARTGVGGVFGAAYRLSDWMILRLVQGQMDNRERYRITSGVEFTWTPKVPQQQKEQKRLIAEGRDQAFTLAAAGFVTPGCG